MDQKIRDQIGAIIEDVDDLTIATLREDGYPQATTVSYVNDGLKIYFGTSDKSQKARNIAHDDRVSLTINRPYQSWAEIEGLSIGGRATRVTEAEEMENIERLMFRKFPGIADLAPEDVPEGTIALYRIDPEVISLLDYSKGFGTTIEVRP